MKNKPLTLEQLRQLDGKPIWIDRLKRWGIVDGEDESVHVKNYGTIDIETFGDDASDYENTLVAYPYKPMHIDRESWKPCEYCVEKHDPCIENSCFRKNGHKCFFHCEKSEKYYEYRKMISESMFCPKCGRPLTIDAWESFEKRISVGE